MDDIYGDSSHITQEEGLLGGDDEGLLILPPIDTNNLLFSFDGGFDEFDGGFSDDEEEDINRAGIFFTSIKTTQQYELYQQVQELLPLVSGGTFNILLIVERESKQRLENAQKMEAAAKRQPQGDNQLYLLSEYTRPQFCNELSALNTDYNVPLAYEAGLLKMLNKYIPFLRLPGKVEQMRPSSLLIHFNFDCCSNGCKTFVGDYVLLTACPVCYTPRFRACILSPCDKLGSERCVHSHDLRVSYQTMQYLSIVNLFTHLARSSEFRRQINFTNLDVYGNNNGHRYISDILNGSVAKMYMETMANDFVQYRTANQDRLLRAGITSFIHIPVLITLFIDGKQIYKSKATTFVPHVLSIMNLPPPFRGICGIGSFVVSIITTSNGECLDNVEDFLLRDCIVEELLHLRRGMEVQDLVDVSVMYFVQVKLLNFSLDTLGVRDGIDIQTSLNLHGDPLCNFIKGVSRKDLSKCSYFGHRYGLPITHPLRLLGQSRISYPDGYFAPGSQETVFSLMETPKFTTPQYLDFCSIEPLLKNKPESEQAIIQAVLNGYFDFFRSKNTSLISAIDYPWYHEWSQYPLLTFLPYCFYHCGDLRDPKQFVRIDNTAHLKAAITAFQTNTNKIKLVWERRRANPGQPNNMPQKVAINGIKGLHKFARLPDFDIEDSIEWDTFHIIGNIMRDIIQLLKGEKGCSEKIRMYCQSTGTHPTLWSSANIPANSKNNKSHINSKAKKANNTSSSAAFVNTSVDTTKPPVWLVANEDQKRIDVAFENIYVPLGKANDFQIKEIFATTGYLKGVPKMRLLLNYMDFMMFCIKKAMPKAYRDLFSMLSSDCVKLLEPIVSEKEADDLYWRILETISVMEGMLPDSEAYFTRHELLHIPVAIKKLGPVKSWWTLSGERINGIVGKYVPHGGMGYNKTVFTKLMNKTSAAFMNFYHGANKDDDDEEYADSIKESYAMLSGNHTLTFSAYRYFLAKKTKNMRNAMVMNTFDILSLLEVSVCEIERQCADLQTALLTSSLYRLFYYYFWYITKGLRKKDFINNNVDVNWTWQWHTWMLDQRESSASTLFNLHSSDLSKLGTISELFAALKVNLCREDYLTIQDIKSWRIIQDYQDANIAGEKFTSRGFQCREINVSIEPSASINKNSVYNKLRLQWWHADNRNSWCKMIVGKLPDAIFLREYPDDEVEVAEKEEEVDTESRSIANQPACKKRTNVNRYVYFGLYAESSNVIETIAGHVNSFFRLPLNHDLVLKRLPMASVTCRKVVNRDRLSFVSAEDGVSFLSIRSFVPIVQIVPTRIANCGIDADDQVVSKPDKRSSGSGRNYSTKPVENICLLEMDRTRRKLMDINKFRLHDLYDNDRDD